MKINLKKFKTPNFLKKIISLMFYFFLIVFLYNYIKTINWELVNLSRINFFYLLLAFPIAILSRFFLPFIWIKLIGEFQEKIKSYRNLLFVYAKAWLGRYIPGKITWLAGKFFFAQKQGISKSTLAITSILEIVFQIFSGLVIGMIFIFFYRGNEINSILLILMVFSFFFLSILITPSIFKKCISFLYTILNKKAHIPEDSLTFKKSIIYICLFSVTHILGGISFFLLTRSIYPNVAIKNILFLTGSFAFSGVIGMMAFFTPSGLGVREGIQLILLKEILPLEVVLITVVIARIWSILMDILFFVFIYLFKSFKEK